MPNQQVHFPSVWQVIGEFVTEVKHLAFSKICPCPFGQAYVRFNSPFDRDAMVLQSPHLFGDVHVVFQHHNQGLNWRNLALNRDIWALLVGFPFGKREIHELANAVRSFGKLLLWDRVRSYKATLVVKIRVEELRDVPASIVMGESKDLSSESWTVHVVIVQQENLGGGPPNEDPVPADGNLHPQPANPFFHPNQLNHFLAPILEHQAQDNMMNQQGNFHQHDLQNEDDEELEDEEELPSWGHWAMGADNDLVDQEIKEGEFLEMSDLMQPLDDQHLPNELSDMDMNSGLTLSVGFNGIEVNNNKEFPLQHLEGNGNLNPMGQAQEIFNGLLDLNLVLGPIDAHQPIWNNQQLPHAQPLGPQLQDFEFVPLMALINDIRLAPKQITQTGLDLNLAISALEQQNAAPVEQLQLEINNLGHASEEEDNYFFALNLAAGEDPVIQLADNKEITLALGEDDDKSVSVDEEIEIIDHSSKVSSKPSNNTASNELSLGCSSSSCSAPPWIYN